MRAGKTGERGGGSMRTRPVVRALTLSLSLVGRQLYARHYRADALRCRSHKRIPGTGVSCGTRKFRRYFRWGVRCAARRDEFRAPQWKPACLRFLLLRTRDYHAINRDPTHL